jgi:acyl-CoA synthetase (AMP-forming)/AMP-acid ligase II
MGYREITQQSHFVADGYAVDELREFIEGHLAKYKLPRSFVVLDSLPLTAIGKN